MGIKKYFTGKTGVIFWVNVLLAVGLLVAIPIVVFDQLDTYTHHGEKQSVPSVVGLKFYEAEETLDEQGFVAVVTDSVYRKTAKPGAVLEQTPKAGELIKPGRLIYLTINLYGEPLAMLPDVVGNMSRRQAEITLKSLGFKLTEPQYVEGGYKDMVLKVKQGKREVHKGEKISKLRALTLVVAAGENLNDSIVFDDGYVVGDSLMPEPTGPENNFDLQL